MVACDTECCSPPIPSDVPARTDGLSVGQLARAVGVKADTVRFYEKAGLLAPPRRTTGDHRRYEATAVERLRFVQGAQRLGLRLREVKDLLQVRDAGTCPCTPAHELLGEHLRAIDVELARLSALRAEVLAMLDGLAASGGGPCPDPVPGTWMPEGGR